MCFPFPHPWIPSLGWGSPQSQEQRWGSTEVFLGSIPAALKNLGTSAASRGVGSWWGRSCWG